MRVPETYLNPQKIPRLFLRPEVRNFEARGLARVEDGRHRREVLLPHGVTSLERTQPGNDRKGVALPICLAVVGQGPLRGFPDRVDGWKKHPGELKIISPGTTVRIPYTYRLTRRSKGFILPASLWNRHLRQNRRQGLTVPMLWYLEKLPILNI